MKRKVLKCDLRQDSGGEITGPVSFSGDSLAVLEAVYSIIEQLAQSAEVPVVEVAADLYRLAAGKVRT